jgi:hypothetical protein
MVSGEIVGKHCSRIEEVHVQRYLEEIVDDLIIGVSEVRPTAQDNWKGIWGDHEQNSNRRSRTEQPG